MERNQIIQMQLNEQEDRETIKGTREEEMYKIYIKGESQIRELNINKNLTINNMIANLQEDGETN